MRNQHGAHLLETYYEMEHSFIAGFLDFLEKKPNVVNVRVHAGRPSNLTQLTAWEACNRCHLPEDLKQFYLANDGLMLQWCYNDVITRSLGRINICCLSHLKPVGEQLLSSGYHLSLDCADTCNDSSWRPTFGGSNQIFSLDYCPTYGHICLVYCHEKGVAGEYSIWLLDLSLDWHYLCVSFSDYLRLAIAHLGLVQWPYALTSVGLSPQHEKWFHQFIPKRLALDHSEAAAAAQKGPVTTGNSDDNTKFTNSIDITKLMQLKSLKERRSRHQSGSIKRQTGGRI